MQKRIFGTENEYSFVAKTRGGFWDSVKSDIYLEPLLDNIGLFESFNRFRVLEKSPKSHEKKYWLGSNGALFYFDPVRDGRLPEYSTPECDSAELCAAHDKAGEVFVEALRKICQETNPQSKFVISKNTTAYPREGSEVGYVGCHENYLTDARFNSYRVGQNINAPNPLAKAFGEFLTPFLISRVVIHGSGGIRWSTDLGWHYVLSNRAFAMKHMTGTGTISDRALVQFKEKCAPPNFARMHLVYSDPNMSSFSTFLKMGTTHLALRAFEENNDLLPPVNVSDPIGAMYDFSKDIGLVFRVVDFRDKKEYTAIQIQREYLDLVLRTVRCFSEEENKILELWQWVLDKLEENPEELCRHLDWVTKLHYLRKIKKGMFSPEGRLFDFLYSDISENGFYNKLRAQGLVEEFADKEKIENALSSPPLTRASARARYISSVLEKKLTGWYIDWCYLNNSPSIHLEDPFTASNHELNKLIESF